jgi:integrase
VFASKNGENPPTQSNFRRRAWVPAVRAAGLTDGPRVTPHDSRHAFASQLADLHLTSSDLAPILGHRTAGITESIYVHAFNREAREERVRQAMTAAAMGGDARPVE